jgi:hypothetical protein
MHAHVQLLKISYAKRVISTIKLACYSDSNKLYADCSSYEPHLVFVFTKTGTTAKARSQAQKDYQPMKLAVLVVAKRLKVVDS